MFYNALSRRKQKKAAELKHLHGVGRGMQVAELKFTGELFLFLISEIIFHVYVTFLWSQVGMQLEMRTVRQTVCPTAGL